MRAPRRRHPPRRTIETVSDGVDLTALSERVSYVGSPEHKTFPSFAGPPRPRADASKCDPKLADVVELTGWLREAVKAGAVGALWEGDFPRYAWCRRGGVAYEARLVNPVQGQYKGYPLQPGEEPGGLE